jgi:hypothetical protein
MNKTHLALKGWFFRKGQKIYVMNQNDPALSGEAKVLSWDTSGHKIKVTFLADKDETETYEVNRMQCFASYK